MNRPPALLWFALLLLLLIPTAAGRGPLDLAGGVLFVLLAIPLLLSGLGWIGWKVLQSRMVNCSACGAAGLKGAERCGVCGTPFDSDVQVDNPQASNGIPASDLTIDVVAQEVDSDS